MYGASCDRKRERLGCLFEILDGLLGGLSDSAIDREDNVTDLQLPSPTTLVSRPRCTRAHVDAHPTRCVFEREATAECPPTAEGVGHRQETRGRAPSHLEHHLRGGGRRGGEGGWGRRGGKEGGWVGGSARVSGGQRGIGEGGGGGGPFFWAGVKALFVHVSCCPLVGFLRVGEWTRPPPPVGRSLTSRARETFGEMYFG